MSYILDALKKAQRERQRDHSLDIDDLTGAAWDPIDQNARAKQIELTSVFTFFLGLISVILIYLVLEGKLNTSGEVSFVEAVEIPHTNKAGSQDVDNHESETAAKTITQIKGDKRPAAPEVSITGSIYIGDGSKGNRIFIGNRVYREGDLIDRAWMLYRIGSDDIELRSGENSILINY